MKKLIKLIIPYIILALFIFLISQYYKNNKNEFKFINQLDYQTILSVIGMCFFYLITEAFILRRSVKFFGKSLTFFGSFLVMNTTYLCNTFIQFSGLGFRAHYLKKTKKIGVIEFVIFSLFLIFIELMVFSFIGLISILIFELTLDGFKIDFSIKAIIFLIFFGSTIFLIFYNQLFNFISNILKFENFKILMTLCNFFENEKKRKLKKNIIKLIPIFTVQFFIISIIFFSIYPIFGKPHSVILSLISATLADYSFIFLITPYAIGISEFFIYIGTVNFEISLGEILFLMNSFRIGLFVFFVPIGIIHLTYLLNKKILWNT